MIEPSESQCNFEQRSVRKSNTAQRFVDIACWDEGVKKSSSRSASRGERFYRGATSEKVQPVQALGEIYNDRAPLLEPIDPTSTFCSGFVGKPRVREGWVNLTRWLAIDATIQLRDPFAQHASSR